MGAFVMSGEDIPKYSWFEVLWRGLLFAITVLIYIVNLSLSIVSNIPTLSPWNRRIGDISRKYESGITPANQVFQIWWMIYFLNAVMCIYLVTVVFRRHNGKALIMSVKFIPDSFLYSYIIYQISGPLWIEVLIREELVGTFLLLVLGVVTKLVCLITSAKALHENGYVMEKEGLKGDIWTMRILVQNAIASYLGWLTCASLINNNIVLIYVSGYETATASWISLGVLNAVVVIWFLLETIVFDKQLRYTFTQYIPFILATSGNYIKNYDPEEPYTVYIFGLMIGVSVLAFVKVLIMIIRSIKNPIHYKTKYDGDDKQPELYNVSNTA